MKITSHKFCFGISSMGRVACQVVFALLLVTPVTAEDKPNPYWISIDAWDVGYKGDPEVVHGKILDLQLDILSTAPILVVLPGLKPFFLELKPRSSGKQALVWRGQVQGDPASVVVISVSDGVASGVIIRSNGLIFRIQHIKGSQYAIEQIDQGRFPKDAKPVEMDCGNSPNSKRC